MPKQNRITIYDIKYRHNEKFPDNHFFDRKTLKFFVQTMKDFRVYKTSHSNIFRIEHTIRSKSFMGVSGFSITKEKFFNWFTGNMYTTLEDAMLDTVLTFGE